jgi:hypothetical protein
MSGIAAEPKSRTLAIIALIVAGASLLFFWIPGAFLLGPIGAVLGLVAWLRARKGKAAAQGLALVAVILSIVSVGVVAVQLYALTFLFG